MSKYRVEPVDPFAPGDGFADWDSHPLRGAFAARLYATLMPGHEDCSFQVSGPGGPVVRVRATRGGDALGYWAFPMVFACRAGAEPKHVKGGISAALDHLGETAKAAGLSRLIIGTEADSSPGPLAATLVDRLAEGTIQATAMIDLTRPAEALRADIRDSYRSLTNWGSRSITMTYVTAAQPDRALFDLFPAFHAKVAGRARSAEYWDVYWREIVAGRAELALGFLEDGALVAGSVVVWADDTAYYASGVYDRDQFDKPLGHWPLWSTILRAKEMGLSRFDLGDIPAQGHANDKEISIAFFKRGFTSGRNLRVRWQIAI
jgi:hypothetical protein